ncbi:MAG TPA: integrase arm-type DNA-binding domain-containing protein [Stellaceae bacterium]|nr:integrase arm-type DNA-binding domain-containing protein [Stellaceae bacterium]
MPSKNLTARNVFSLPAPERGRVEYFDPTTPGFGLRVTSNGARSWIVLYRCKGTLRRYTIGTLSTTLGLALARDQAKAVLRRAAVGEDPAAEKKQQRRASTFKELAELYVKEHAKAKKRSWKADENILRKDLIPRFGARKACDITRADIRAMLGAIVARGAPIQANRTLEVARKLFNWAIGAEEGGVEHNPCGHLGKPSKERRRERVLSDDEIRAIWRALPGIDPTLADVYRLLFVTAARKAEVTEAEWPEIDGDWWTQPGSGVKNGLPHRVYLTEVARKLLAAIAEPGSRAGRVFPSRGKTGLRFGVYDDHPELLKASGTSGWSFHDIRRTVATNLGRLGFSRFIQDRVLNHVDRTVGSIYDVYSYDAEKRQALTAWGRRLEEIVSGKPAASNVVPMVAVG